MGAYHGHVLTQTYLLNHSLKLTSVSTTCVLYLLTYNLRTILAYLLAMHLAQQACSQLVRRQGVRANLVRVRVRVKVRVRVGAGVSDEAASLGRTIAVLARQSRGNRPPSG